MILAALPSITSGSEAILRVSPLRQIEFIDRLRRGVLPVSQRTQDLVRDILPVTKVGNSVIRSKSGLIGVDDKSPAGGVSATVGWLVGWVARGPYSP